MDGLPSSPYAILPKKNRAARFKFDGKGDKHKNRKNGDGNLDVYANNVHVMRFVSGSIQSNKTINITGRVNPSDYGNFDSRYVKDVRLGSQQYYGVNNWQTWNFQCPSGHVLSGINVQDTGSNSADNIAGVYYRPVQKYINGTWYNVASV